MSDNQQHTEVVNSTSMARGPNVPTIYVESVAKIQLGFPISRLYLQSGIEQMKTETGIEQVRQLAVELVLSTGSLLELVKHLTVAINNGEPQLREFLALHNKQLTEVLDAVKTEIAPSNS